MEYGSIASVDKPVSRVAQGTTMIKTKDLDGSFALLDAAFECGITLFDTAHVYAGGDCERALGAWVRERGVRDNVVVLGKGAHHHEDTKRVTPPDIASDLNDSLERLGMDFIDLYLLHRDDPEVPVGEIVDALNEHHTNGRIGGFGGSNWSHQRISEANAYAEANSLCGFVASSPNFSLAEMVSPPWPGCVSISGPGGEHAREWYTQSRMPLLPWSSLAGGFFSGRAAAKDFDKLKDGQNPYYSQANFRRLERVEQLAGERDLSVPQVALGYVLNSPMNVFALTGGCTPDEIAQNAASCDIKLTPREAAWLDLRAERR